MSEPNAKVHKVLAGDHAAFSELYNETIHSVYRMLYFLTESKADLDDIVQDVYVELYRSLPRFDSSRSLQSWLYGIAIRQHQSYRRKKWRQARKEHKERQLQNAMVEFDFSNAVVEKLSANAAITEVEGLSYKLKQVVILRYLNDLSQEEIAEIAGIPLGTVKSRLNLALRKLRTTIGRNVE
ncbi:sigma-70 family RNA polymerase sigma factor [Paenibacillus sp. CAU 1782]